MAISTNLTATLSLNTGAGTNIPTPTDAYSATATAGTLAVGPISVTVTSSPTSVPLSAIPATAVYTLMIANIGANPLVVDMRNGAGSPNSSQVTIQAGGRIYFHNVTLTAPTGTAAACTWANWQLSSASGTTASIALAYT